MESIGVGREGGTETGRLAPDRQTKRQCLRCLSIPSVLIKLSLALSLTRALARSFPPLASERRKWFICALCLGEADFPENEESRQRAIDLWC